MNNIQLFQKQNNKNINILKDIQSVIDLGINTGQLGDPIFLETCNANDLIETGVYIVNIYNSGLNNNWPITDTVAALVIVYHLDNNITYQLLLASKNIFLKRRLNSRGEWEKWISVCLSSNYLTFYISKDGDDNNIGISPDYPVASIDRAIEIANSITFSNPNSTIIFLLGSGNWGNVYFRVLPYNLTIKPYDNTLHTEYSSELPVFDSLTFDNTKTVGLQNLCIKRLTAYSSTIYITSGYKEISYISTNDTSHINFSSGSVDTNILGIRQLENNNSYFIYNSQFNSIIQFGNINIKLLENINNGNKSLFYADTYGKFLFNNSSSMTFSANGFTFSGTKLNINDSSDIYIHTTKLTDFLNRITFGKNDPSGTLGVKGSINCVPISIASNIS